LPKQTTKEKHVTITAPKLETASFKIVGISPLVINRFSAREIAAIKAKQEAGPTAKKGAKREAKNFQDCFEQARHKSAEGWDGIHAAAFRNAMISACRLAGFQMTRAKLSVFVVADGHDAEDGMPLVKITKGKPHYVEHVVRNETGVVDLRARPMWDPGWEAVVTVRWDADQFTAADVANLLHRAGMQCGVGEGRPDSKNSAGMGWGLFELADAKRRAA
jgi:hypothetical protein